MPLKQTKKVPLEFVKKQDGQLVLNSTGFSIGVLAEYHSKIHPGCMSLEEGIEYLLELVNLALVDDFSRNGGGCEQ